MTRQLIATMLILGGLFIPQANTAAADDPKQLAADAIAKVGGEEKLFKLFRLREHVLVTSTPTPLPANAKGNRTSVIQAGGDWWVGKSKRAPDKALSLCWGWSLRILLDPKSKLEAIPETTIAEKPVIGIRVSESITPPMDLLFDKSDKRLVAIDFADSRHLCSDWKTNESGQSYPAHVVGYKFTNRATGAVNEKQWYQTDILEITPLSELPAELK